MSAASNLPSAHQFLCSLCLDVFTDPVSTTCGHNFCKTCITQYWNTNVSYQCPMCKEIFDSRPQLKVNAFIREMVAQFRHDAQQEARPGEVPCDVCTGTKLKALKSCPECLLSYCQTHLEPHLRTSHLKTHQLMKPVENLKDEMCVKHNKPLELFCKTDQTCVCELCSVLDHTTHEFVATPNGSSRKKKKKTHEFVPLGEEYEEKKAELEKTEAEIQQMTQERLLKIQEITESVKMSKDAADRKTVEGIHVFIALKESVERGLKKLIKEIQKKHKTAEKQAEGFMKDLEQEIFELMKSSSEVKQLLHSEDHLHLLSLSALTAAPPTKDWTEISIHPPSYKGTVVRAVAQLEETIRKTKKKKMLELKEVQQYAVDVTLDPDTAAPNLILSDDGKQGICGDVRKNLPDNPERFRYGGCVLGKQSFSSGRFYFEVQVKGRTDWVLGVARESIDRKSGLKLCPQEGFWTVRLRYGYDYKALAFTDVYLRLRRSPEKVGVFVDYEEGVVSFHNVETAALVYSFTGCSFTQKLHPFFSLCDRDGSRNSAPIVITPINRTK